MVYFQFKYQNFSDIDSLVKIYSDLKIPKVRVIQLRRDHFDTQGLSDSCIYAKVSNSAFIVCYQRCIAFYRSVMACFFLQVRLCEYTILYTTYILSLMT